MTQEEIAAKAIADAKTAADAKLVADAAKFEEDSKNIGNVPYSAFKKKGDEAKALSEQLKTLTENFDKFKADTETSTGESKTNSDNLVKEYEEKINGFIKDKEKSLISNANPADKEYLDFKIKQKIEKTKDSETPLNFETALKSLQENEKSLFLGERKSVGEKPSSNQSSEITKAEFDTLSKGEQFEAYNSGKYKPN